MSDHCRRLEMQRIAWALPLAFARAGRSMPARIAIMAITTSSSMRVKPGRGRSPAGTSQTGIAGTKGVEALNEVHGLHATQARQPENLRKGRGFSSIVIWNVLG